MEEDNLERLEVIGQDDNTHVQKLEEGSLEVGIVLVGDKLCKLITSRFILGEGGRNGGIAGKDKNSRPTGRGQ